MAAGAKGQQLNEEKGFRNVLNSLSQHLDSSQHALTRQQSLGQNKNKVCLGQHTGGSQLEVTPYSNKGCSQTEPFYSGGLTHPLRFCPLEATAVLILKPQPPTCQPCASSSRLSLVSGIPSSLTGGCG